MYYFNNGTTAYYFTLSYMLHVECGKRTIIVAESQLEDCRGRIVYGKSRLRNIVNECSQTDVTGMVFRE